VTNALPRGWFADVLLGRRPREARAAALALADEGLPPREIYLGVLGPAMEEVGSRWQRGIATVAQEHLATAVVSSIMATLAPRLAEPPPVARLAVLACTDGELHVVGLRMLGDFLEADGWEVLYLGAETPGADLSRFVADRKPDVVGLSTTLSTHLEAAKATVASLQALPIVPFILVGGRAYGGDADVARRVGADAFGSDAGEASKLLRARFNHG
jgi:MerR family transcriptional regulator, light-induced transcriptional regulator